MLSKIVVQVNENSRVMDVNSVASETSGYNYNEIVVSNWFEKFPQKGDL